MPTITLSQIIQILNNWQPEVLVNNQIQAQWTLPTSLEHGILTTNCAFVAAKIIRRNPIELAAELKTDLEIFLENQGLNKLLTLQTAGPYLNLELTQEAFPHLDFRLQIEQKDDKIMLDYVSNNAAKPLHAGHVRNVNFGDALRRCLVLQYPNLKTNNYWGDWGVQFGILLWGYQQFQNLGKIKVTINGIDKEFEFISQDKLDIDILVAIYIWANQQKETIENWDKLVRDEFLQLESGDTEREKIRQFLVDISMQSVNEVVKLLNMPPHDYQLGESFFAKLVPDIAEYLESNQIWKSEQKARYLDLEEIIENWADAPHILVKKKKSLGRCYLISSDGYTSYAMRDIACRIYFASELQVDQTITITGNEQIHHFEQFTAILVYLASLPSFVAKYGQEVAKRLQMESLTHISYGFLTLTTGKMSTRKGNILTFKSVISEITEAAKLSLTQRSEDEIKNLDHKSQVLAVAALKWYDLARDASSDLVLDIPKILSFEGNTGVYQLYTVARINSILRNNQSFNAEPTNFDQLNLTETLLLKECWTFSNTVQKVIDSYKPHFLTNHLHELATGFNSWYAKYSVTKETNKERKTQLLVFCTIIKKQLETGLDLLGIEVLEEF